MSNENASNTAIGTMGDILSEEAKAALSSVSADENMDEGIVAEENMEAEEATVESEPETENVDEPAEKTDTTQQEKKNKPAYTKPVKKDRQTIRMYHGMDKDGEYISYKLGNTLITGGVKSAIDNVVTNMFSQFAVQYENTDLAVEVWGDMSNSWFGKSRFCDRIGKLNVVNATITSYDTAYVDWLAGIHAAAVTRLGTLAKVKAASIDNYEFLTGERIPTLIAIAIGAPAGINYKVGEYISGMLVNIKSISSKVGVYVINVTEPGARIGRNDIFPMTQFIVTPTSEEQSQSLFDDDRAKHGVLTKGYAWVSDTSRDDEYSDTRLMIPEYTRDKISDIVNGKIHPNRCVFQRNKLKQLSLLNFN